MSCAKLRGQTPGAIDGLKRYEVKKICAEIEGVCPGDTIRVTIKRKTGRGAQP